ncbi:MAG: hypothetical protein EOM06_12955 [Sphingobacteriia bacterium]|nr:hypothetical protein [Sphingobacteriia bacterium]
MADKFRDKYRIPSARLQSWDYGWNAKYFVTICTRLMVHHFGRVINGKMQLSEPGIFAEKFWYEIPYHFPFVILDAFVVMPNHIHGIIIINKDDDGRGKITQTSNKTTKTIAQTSESAQTPEPGVCIPFRQNPFQSVQPPDSGGSPSELPPSESSLQPPDSGAPTGGKNPKWKPAILGVILNQYKRMCTINIRKINPDFEWQPRFHDHIIRNEREYYTIRNYIINNPTNWDKDKFCNE